MEGALDKTKDEQTCQQQHVTGMQWSAQSGGGEVSHHAIWLVLVCKIEQNIPTLSTKLGRKLYRECTSAFGLYLVQNLLLGAMNLYWTAECGTSTHSQEHLASERKVVCTKDNCSSDAPAGSSAHTFFEAFREGISTESLKMHKRGKKLYSVEIQFKALHRNSKKSIK